ncbi:hypothetical protein [Pseudomonas sp. MPC6]|uniref:hypothetical protein n=1 Tax=unclassified Pseudomonas TaxID=196821 RepID=UPI0011104517|nr:hypothetical protein [Pseudomonas sp. MPC6]QCY09448.1 hypothetical protein ELQ88_00985 [Pseudomonas sp. MPC6]
MSRHDQGLESPNAASAGQLELNVCELKTRIQQCLSELLPPFVEVDIDLALNEQDSVKLKISNSRFVNKALVEQQVRAAFATTEIRYDLIWSEWQGL